MLLSPSVPVELHGAVCGDRVQSVFSSRGLLLQTCISAQVREFYYLFNSRFRLYFQIHQPKFKMNNSSRTACNFLLGLLFGLAFCLLLVSKFTDKEMTHITEILFLRGAFKHGLLYLLPVC